jgi:putative FmdB family regulatory protein
MPIHEYQCEKCGYIFEEVTMNLEAVKISTNCPACQEKDEFGIAKKIMSKGSFRVHGYNSNNGYAGNMR